MKGLRAGEKGIQSRARREQEPGLLVFWRTPKTFAALAKNIFGVRHTIFCRTAKTLFVIRITVQAVFCKSPAHAA
jgi:hypothetical protein